MLNPTFKTGDKIQLVRLKDRQRVVYTVKQVFRISQMYEIEYFYRDKPVTRLLNFNIQGKYQKL